MAGSVIKAFPAGYESDDSFDGQWDTGHVSNIQQSCSIQVLDDGDTDTEDNVSLLKRAINQGDTTKIKQLLDKGVDVDCRLDYEWSPLMCAVTIAKYDVAKLLLDRGASANFSKDNWTVLMASCTASASEDKIAACVGLLLSRKADPNMADRSQITCLMLAARDGYTKVISLLMSHGAKINMQDNHGYTALCIAVQYEREEAVLKLLELGADKSIQTHKGMCPVDLAENFKHTQIAKILVSFDSSSAKGNTFMKNALFKFFTTNSECPPSIEGVSKMSDLELLLHGLNLGYLSDILTDNNILWNDLLTMDKKDLEEIGITDPSDQQKMLKALQQIHLDKVDLDIVDLKGVGAIGSEELQSFLISVSQQCCYLTETLQDVIKGFPHHSSQLVFSLDSKKDAQATCNQLVIQTKDLHKQVACFRRLLCQITDSSDCCQVRGSGCQSSWRTHFLSRITLSAVGAATLLVLYKTACSRFSLR
ncbi:ankyrin repeat, SAM and basic leucine zipper domain-containing protein 1 [Gouania willdenowi]|uniref:SAM domain-containing protein n=1 Tax=Gouania willdenowi TaxID=441366 RepID=A0A8C5DK59_GOUWI|nr:ankyrin repeat, SAM and basic leucine zipper domain-containing protein 1 [Gouania willdenowi]